MCELLAISSRFPVTTKLSLMRFAEHGGHSGPHQDGWGIAYYHGNDIQRIREPCAAADSDWVRFVANHHLSSSMLVGHLRSVTRGGRNLANTQPFTRELAGRMHLFVHNGDLPELFNLPQFKSSRYLPLGNTDSELVFCCLMDRLASIWLNGHEPPSLTERLDIITELAKEIRSYGPANFLYSDGEYLFAHSHRRTNPVTKHIDAPGLYLLKRHCPATELNNIEIPGLSVGSHEQTLTLLASVPLSDEPWQSLDEGEIVVLKDGEVVTPSKNW